MSGIRSYVRRAAGEVYQGAVYFINYYRGRLLVENNGFNEFNHFRVTDFMEKGKSPVSDDRVEMIVEKGEQILA